MFWSFIESKTGNNAISYEARKKLNSSTKLYIPPLKHLYKFSTNEIQLGDKIVFEEIINWKLQKFQWLKNYLFFKKNNTFFAIFDNHNVAFYFIAKFFFSYQKKVNLIHIDQHSDLNLPPFDCNCKSITEATNYSLRFLNVWNYLIPAKNNFLNEIYQVRSEYALYNYFPKYCKNSKILNIDLDFWDEKMWSNIDSLFFIKKHLLKFKLVLIATSPFFINQKLALQLARILLDFT
jgi:hypothetical protein